MKREKDIPAQEKARSHGYCCPYRQWGIAIVSSWNGVLDFTYPLAFSKSVLYAVTQEANPYSWRENQSATVTSAFYNQSLTSCQVVAKTITNGGNVLDTNSSTKVLIIGY